MVLYPWAKRQNRGGFFGGISGGDGVSLLFAGVKFFYFFGIWVVSRAKSAAAETS